MVTHCFVVKNDFLCHVSVEDHIVNDISSVLVHTLQSTLNIHWTRGIAIPFNEYWTTDQYCMTG